MQSRTTIASGYLFQCDPVTFVDAPTGLVYDAKKDILYVASTVDNAVFAVSKASQRNDNGGTGQIIYQDETHLHGPLGMAAAPNGDLLVSNNDAINSDPKQPSEIVEFTLVRPLRQAAIDRSGAGRIVRTECVEYRADFPVRRRGRQSIHTQHLDVADPLVKQLVCGTEPESNRRPVELRGRRLCGR